jgi:hypothetical protein
MPFDEDIFKFIGSIYEYLFYRKIYLADVINII